jgi:cytochrome c-type biogenesis protein CcmH/NrfG
MLRAARQLPKNIYDSVMDGDGRRIVAVECTDRHFVGRSAYFRSKIHHMLARLLVPIAPLISLYAQDSDDVMKYLLETRAKAPTPSDVKADQQEQLAVLTKQLQETMDPVHQADLCLRISGMELSPGDSGSAIAAARNAFLLQPESSNVALGLARILIDSHQTAEVSALIGADPSDGAALLRKAREPDRGPYVSVAAFCAELAHELQPGNLEVMDALGTTYMSQGNTTGANQLFLQAIVAATHSTDHYHYHYHFGLPMLRRGYPEYAREELQTALDCRPADEECAYMQSALASLDVPK